MHDLYPQKQPPTLSAITLGFVVATFLPPLAYLWFGRSHSPDTSGIGWWLVLIPIALSVVVGIFLGCYVSSDVPVGCVVLLSPLVPTAVWLALWMGMMLWTGEQPFSRVVAWLCLLSLIGFLLSTPTAGVFVLTRWLAKGRG